jgi:hypothetical protein
MSNTKVSKRMSKLCQKKCRKPKCPKGCQNNVEKNIKNKVSKKCQKNCRNQHPILVVQLLSLQAGKVVFLKPWLLAVDTSYYY